MDSITAFTVYSYLIHFLIIIKIRDCDKTKFSGPFRISHSLVIRYLDKYIRYLTVSIRFILLKSSLLVGILHKSFCKIKLTIAFKLKLIQ